MDMKICLLGLTKDLFSDNNDQLCNGIPLLLLQEMSSDNLRSEACLEQYWLRCFIVVVLFIYSAPHLGLYLLSCACCSASFYCSIVLLSMLEGSVFSPSQRASTVLLQKLGEDFIFLGSTFHQDFPDLLDGIGTFQ